MRRECRERLPPPPRVSDPDMHHGTCVTHVPWCMPGSLLSSLLWSRWRGKRSRHSRRTRNTLSYVSGKRPMVEPVRVLGPCKDRLSEHHNSRHKFSACSGNPENVPDISVSQRRLRNVQAPGSTWSCTTVRISPDNFLYACQLTVKTYEAI